MTEGHDKDSGMCKDSGTYKESGAQKLSDAQKKGYINTQTERLIGCPVTETQISIGTQKQGDTDTR